MLQQARERYGHHPGFDAVVTFIDHSALIAGLSWFAAEGSTGKELGRKLVAELKARDQFIAITFCVLQGCRRLLGDVGVLAIRILEQMNNDLKTKPDYRKPAMYVAGIEADFGDAVTIDDRFWGEEWLEAGP